MAAIDWVKAIANASLLVGPLHDVFSGVQVHGLLPARREAHAAADLIAVCRAHAGGRRERLVLTDGFPGRASSVVVLTSGLGMCWIRLHSRNAGGVTVP